MLKIKNNLSEKTVKKKLLKLGFIESWNYIGMIKHAHLVKCLDPSISIKDKCIKINIYCAFDNEEQQNEFIADTIYDLIKAGLVEKVKEE